MAEQTRASRYEGEQGKRYHESKRRIPDEAAPWVARLRAEKLGPFIRETDSVLEYGVGFGWNLAALRCARRVGYDVSEFLGPEVEKLGVEFVSDARGLARRSFDVVICHHMLEHAANPAAILSEIGELLKPRGRLLLFVPYEIEKRYRRYDPAEPNHHLFSWNAQTLGNLVEETGFKISAAGLGRFGYDRFASTLAQRWKIGEGGYRLLYRVLHLLRPIREVRVIAETRPTGASA